MAQVKRTGPARNKTAQQTERQAVGRWGEEAAASYLRSLGYNIRAQNIHTPYGEIDLIAEQERPGQGRLLVFVEVKARTTRSYGEPEAAVTSTKRDHMLKAAQHYIQENPELADEWRIDVIAVQRLARSQPARFTHFENAVECS